MMIRGFCTVTCRITIGLGNRILGDTSEKSSGLFGTRNRLGWLSQRRCYDGVSGYRALSHILSYAQRDTEDLIL